MSKVCEINGGFVMGNGRDMELINDLIERTTNLNMFDDKEKDDLVNETKMIIRRLFSNAEYNRTLSKIGFYNIRGYDHQRTWSKARDQLLSLLQTMKKELEWFPVKEEVDVEREVINLNNGEQKKVFIVHGHDESMKLEVARILEKLGLSPIILHEQEDRGMTVIEKFEQNALDCHFAVVLLSPDDKGYAVKDDISAANFRARQNVVLELGYFAGRLGRANVLTLVKHDPTGNLEIPSDYAGVVYTPYDASGAWKLRLVKALKSVDYDVDANNMI